MLVNDMPYWAATLLTIGAMSGIGWSIGLLAHYNKMRAKAVRQSHSRTHYSYTSAYRSRR